MFKIIAIIVFLAIAAYCSYQIAVIVNWQTMLRNKQKTFGVTFASNPANLIGTMKQIRTISATCAALTLVIPGNMLPFYQNQVNEQYLIADGISQDSAADDHFGGVAKSSLAEVAEAPKTEVVTTSALPATTRQILSNHYKANASLVPQQWHTLQSNIKEIEEYVIESYPNAPEHLTQARMKSLLLKTIKEVDMDFGEEHYVVKLTIKNEEGIVLLMKQVNGTFYILDRDSDIVYVLE